MYTYGHLQALSKMPTTAATGYRLHLDQWLLKNHQHQVGWRMLWKEHTKYRLKSIHISHTHVHTHAHTHTHTHTHTHLQYWSRRYHAEVVWNEFCWQSFRLSDFHTTRPTVKTCMSNYSLTSSNAVGLEIGSLKDRNDCMWFWIKVCDSMTSFEASAAEASAERKINRSKRGAWILMKKNLITFLSSSTKLSLWTNTHVHVDTSAIKVLQPQLHVVMQIYTLSHFDILKYCKSNTLATKKYSNYEKKRVYLIHVLYLTLVQTLLLMYSVPL